MTAPNLPEVSGAADAGVVRFCTTVGHEDDRAIGIVRLGETGTEHPYCGECVDILKDDGVLVRMWRNFDQGELDALDLAQAVRAFMALAMRLWTGDEPLHHGVISSVDSWAYNLPEQERAALNAMLGENFGGLGPNWDADHPVCNIVRRLSDQEEQA